ncbi:MAG: hypothetical protein RSH78_04225, partial [Bacilli bacterium]
FNNYFKIEDIWLVYNQEIKYSIRNIDYLCELQLPFLLNMLDRCSLFDELHDTIKEEIKDSTYQSLDITLTHTQKTLFDIYCKDNCSKFETVDNYVYTEDTIDIDNIDWKNDSIYYWTNTIDALYENGEDVSVLTSYLLKNYYFSSAYTQKNLNALLFAGLENNKSHKKFLDLLFKSSGHCGFYCVINAYKDNPERSLQLYKRYHQFCQLLTRM